MERTLHLPSSLDVSLDRPAHKPKEDFLMFRITGKKTALPVLLSAALLTVSATGCKVTKTQDGKLPEVQVKGGQLPKYDVKGPKVDVKTETKQIEVPTDVTVKTKKKDIQVPKVSVTPPS
jgi:hypothetical protein